MKLLTLFPPSSTLTSPPALHKKPHQDLSEPRQMKPRSPPELCCQSWFRMKLKCLVKPIKKTLEKRLGKAPRNDLAQKRGRKRYLMVQCLYQRSLQKNYVQKKLRMQSLRPLVSNLLSFLFSFSFFFFFFARIISPFSSLLPLRRFRHHRR